MATFESKYGIDDEVITNNGNQGFIKGIEINAHNEIRYRVVGNISYGFFAASELKPAPKEMFVAVFDACIRPSLPFDSVDKAHSWVADFYVGSTYKIMKLIDIEEQE